MVESEILAQPLGEHTCLPPPPTMPVTDPRFAALSDPDYVDEPNGGPSSSHIHHDEDDTAEDLGSEAESDAGGRSEEDENDEHGSDGGIGTGMDPSGFAGPSEKTVKPLTPEALAAFKAAQEKAGVVYISRIPPGMRPTKVRHLMSAYGEVGRIYLQPEGLSAIHTLASTFSLLNRPEKDISS